jgi:hypothetical protein
MYNDRLSTVALKVQIWQVLLIKRSIELDLELLAAVGKFDGGGGFASELQQLRLVTANRSTGLNRSISGDRRYSIDRTKFARRLFACGCRSSTSRSLDSRSKL